jgi:hypothetical protein
MIMNQEELFKAAQVAIKDKSWPALEEVLSSKDEVPTVDTVSNILQEAVDQTKWTLVKGICEFDGVNKPSPQAVDYAIRDCENCTIFKYIYENSKTKPSEEGINYLFETASTTLVDMLSIAQYLILNAKHQLKQTHIDMAFERMVDLEMRGLLEAIYATKSINKPTQSLIDSVSIKILRLSDQWELFEKICTINDGNSPGQIVISTAINSIFNKISFKNADIDPLLERFKFLFEKSKIKPSQDDIESLLKKTIDSRTMSDQEPGTFKAIQFLFGSDNPVKPEQKVIDATLNYAASQGYLEGVQYLVGIHKNTPTKLFSEQGIHDALNKAEHNVEIAEILKALLPKSEAAKPEATKPEATKPEATKPEATKPEATKPEATKPEATKPEATKPEATKPKATKPKSTEPEATKPKATKPKSTKPKATKPKASKPKIPNGEIQNQLAQAISNGELLEVKEICAQINHENRTFINMNKLLKLAVKETDIEDCLLEMQKIFKLYQHIDALESHGKKLEKDDKSYGESAVQFANALTPLVNNYVYAFFNNQDLTHPRKEFSTAFEKGFDHMSEHRAKWKLRLANIALAASVIGLLVNYLKSGQMFFSKTQREEHYDKIGKDVSNLKLK